MTSRPWTVYIAQDKHLDYNWCGTPAEIEARMVALVDYYLDETVETGGRWNLDSTLWYEVYRRHRGPEGAARLVEAISEGRIGYGANQSVLLWGLLSTELAIRACYGALDIAGDKHVGKRPAVPSAAAQDARPRTALIMENHGLPWGAATVLSAAGLEDLGRGIYALRAESYVADREPVPLFWWVAPNGERVLVRWDLYEETRRWGGYAEAYALSEIAGERWDAFHLQDFGDRNTDEVYRRRVAYIETTVARYAAYGDAYPIRSILLLGTGWDNWTRTPDITRFIQRFNAEYAGDIRLVDARYDQFFAAARAEVRDRDLCLPTLTGTFGICWEEWAAHLAALTADFREAERLLRLAEARCALETIAGVAAAKDAAAKDAVAIAQGFDALLRFAEHDFGGTDRARAAISAGVRAAAATEALTIGRALAPVTMSETVRQPVEGEPASFTFGWRGGRVRFDPELGAVASIIDGNGYDWVPKHAGVALGEFVHTRYRSGSAQDRVLPEPILRDPETHVVRATCVRAPGSVEGVVIETQGVRWGFEWSTRWLFHATRPWIDVTYELKGGWTEDPQSVQMAFPLALAGPAYRYDTLGAAAVVAGPVAAGGHDLPGANPSLYAVQTYAAVSGRGGGTVGTPASTGGGTVGTPASTEGGAGPTEGAGVRTVLLLTPDAHLVQFGADAVEMRRVDRQALHAQLVSMPMMNITRNDWQLNQGGARRWRFRYRLVLSEEPFDPLQAIDAVQGFSVPPFLQTPGHAPAVENLTALDIVFDGGPVVALKVAEDGERVICRLWNVLDHVARGSLRLPAGYNKGHLCDALERRQRDLPVQDGRLTFDAGAGDIITLALCRI